jgi:hypothetical protein
MADERTPGEQLSLFDVSREPSCPPRHVASGAPPAEPAHAQETSAHDESPADSASLEEPQEPVFVAEVALLPDLAREEPRSIETRAAPRPLWRVFDPIRAWFGVLTARWRGAPPRWRRAISAGSAVLAGAAVYAAWPSDAPVRDRSTSLQPAPPNPNESASRSVAPLLRVHTQGAMVRIALEGARGRYAHVVAIDRDGSLVRLYPFESGDSVLVEGDGWLPGNVELAEAGQYRIRALVTEAPMDWAVARSRFSSAMPLDAAGGRGLGGILIEAVPQATPAKPVERAEPEGEP